MDGLPSSPLLPGFRDPVADSQAAFRAVLDATARPGKIVTLPGLAAGPTPLAVATATIVLTLLDHETSLWLDPAADNDPVRSWLRFHCGCPLRGAPFMAAFAIVADAVVMPTLSSFDQGTPEYPDRSTTVILQVEALSNEGGWKLSGPGIKTSTNLKVEGLPKAFPSWVRDNRATFPCGVDLLLVAGDKVAALPRSVRLEG